MCLSQLLSGVSPADCHILVCIANIVRQYRLQGYHSSLLICVVFFPAKKWWNFIVQGPRQVFFPTEPFVQISAWNCHQTDSQRPLYSRWPSPPPLDNWSCSASTRAEQYVPPSLDEVPGETHMSQDENTQPSSVQDLTIPSQYSHLWLTPLELPMIPGVAR